jgi:hypothetical protein
MPAGREVDREQPADRTSRRAVASRAYPVHTEVTSSAG